VDIAASTKEIKIMSTVSGAIRQGIKQFYRESLTAAFSEHESAMVLLSLVGNFNQTKIDELLPVLQPLLLDNGAKRRVMKRISSVIIETLQNISKHGTRSNSEYDSFLVVSQSDDHFTITTGNLLLTADGRSVADKISTLNSLSPEELRKLYIETLCNDDFSYKGGAGLGLITIAKKSKHAIAVDVHEIAEKLSYFVQSVRIDNRE
jgi:hypothetical protein